MAIVVNFVIIVIATEPNFAGFHPLLRAIETVFFFLFSAEYVIRCLYAYYIEGNGGNRGRTLARFATSLPSLLDLVVLFTFYRMAFADLEMSYAVLLALRFVRLLRIVWHTVSPIYKQELESLKEALLLRKEALIISLLFSGGLILTFSVVLFLVERGHPSGTYDSLLKSLYWSIITLTAVGYGDVVPASALGKVVAMLASLSSVLFVALPAAIFTAALLSVFKRK